MKKDMEDQGYSAPSFPVPLKIIKAIPLKMVLVRKTCGVRKIKSLSERIEKGDLEEKS